MKRLHQLTWWQDSGKAHTAHTTVCPRAEDAAAWAVGALSPQEKAAFEKHRLECTACMQATDRDQALVTRMRNEPSMEPSTDLTPRIMAALPANAFAKTRPSFRLLFLPSRILWPAAAAALIVCIVGLWRLHTVGDPSRTASIAGCVWIAHHQESDGSWDPIKLGGSSLYRPALTALATLALSREPDRYAPQIANACLFLMRRQEDDGGIGIENSGRMYNHALATYTLLVIYAQGGHHELQSSIRRALAFTRKSQQNEGGWGYRVAADEPANTAITAWQVQVLSCARKFGWSDVDINLRKGLAWLRQRADGQGRFGYTANASSSEMGSATLDAMATYTLLRAGTDYPELQQTAQAAIGQLRIREKEHHTTTDFYRAFFSAAAWEAAGDSGRAKKLRQDMSERLEKTGENSGSWTPKDAWGVVGGRIYATSLAVLTIRPHQDHL